MLYTIDVMVLTSENKPQFKIDLRAPDPLATVNRSEAAKVMGVHVSVVSRILSRDLTQRRIPRVSIFYALSRYLGIGIDELYRLLYD